MFEHVIVGVDGGAGGRDAIALAGVLRGARSVLTLAHVHYDDSDIWRGSGALYTAQASESGRELLVRERDHAQVVAKLCSYGASSVGRGLHELAEVADADLLVIGSSRRGRVGRVFMGDDTRAALSAAPCAVAIAPAGYRAGSLVLMRIGVGYNGSTEAAHAVGVARRIAAVHHARLSALEVVHIPGYFVYQGAAEYLPEAEELVEDAHDRMAAALGDVEAHAKYGDPSEELAHYSASTDLLVVGSRGYGPLGRILFGSTAQRLARSAHSPLLVITRAARAADTAYLAAPEDETAAPAAPHR